MKKIAMLVSLVLGSYAQADYRGDTTCRGFYGASVEAVYNSQSVMLGKKAVSEGQSTKDKLYTLNVSDAWPNLNETKSGKHIELESTSLGDGMRAYISDNLAVFPENVPGVASGQGKVIILCKTEQGGF